jgi:hypothetical protein
LVKHNQELTVIVDRSIGSTSSVLDDKYILPID